MLNKNLINMELLKKYTIINFTRNLFLITFIFLSTNKSIIACIKVLTIITVEEVRSKLKKSQKIDLDVRRIKYVQGNTQFKISE